MKCSTLRIGNSTAIVCGTARVQRCKECNQRPVTKLCDYQIRTVDRGKLSDEQYAALTTCSKPMCEDCSRPQPDGLDYCRIHEDLAIKKENRALVLARSQRVFEHWLLRARINPMRVWYVSQPHQLLGLPPNGVLVMLRGWKDRPDSRRERDYMLEIVRHLEARADLRIVRIDPD